MATDVKLVISAQDKTAASFAKAQKNIDALKTSSLGLAASLGAGVSVVGLVSFAKAAIDSLDALNDLSDATGSSVENLSALEDVAARTGTSFDTVEAALVKFNSALNSAKKDSPQALAIEAIGLSVEKLKALDPAEALRQVAVALAGFADDGNKARLEQELFGKSVAKVAPLLNDLAKQTSLVGTVTKEQTAEAEKFNQQLSALQKNVLDVSRYFASDFVTSMNAAAKAYKEFGLIAAVGVAFGGDEGFKANKKMVELTNELLPLENEINRLRASGTALDSALLTKKTQRLKALQEEIKVTQQLREQLDGRYAASVNGPSAARIQRQGVDKPTLPSSLEKPTTGGGKSAAAKQSEADRYLETLTKQLEKTQELTAVQQVGFDIIAGRTGKLTTDQQNNLVQLAQKIDAIRAEGQAEKELTAILKDKRQASIEAGDAVAKANEEYQGLLARLLAATPSANLESQRNDVQLLTKEFEAGRISETLYLEAVSARLDLVGEKVGTTKTLAEDLGLTFTSAFENAIVGGQSFSEVLQGLEQDIIRIVTRKMVTEPLGNAITGGLNGLMKGLFSADGGGYTGAGPRSGGMDGKGGFMAMLHPQETVVDHTRGQSAGNSVSLVINQSFAQGTSRQTTMQAAADASRQLQYAGRNL